MKSAFLISLLPILVAAQFPNPFGGRSCSDVCESANVQCSSKTLCECQNHANVQCYLSRQGRCNLVLEACPVAPGAQAANAEYPACGKTLQPCAANKTCHKVGTGCNGPNCIGMCIPNIPPPPPKAQPAPKQQAQPKGQGKGNGQGKGGKGGAPKGGAPGGFPGAGAPGGAPFPGAAPGAPSPQWGAPPAGPAPMAAPAPMAPAAPAAAPAAPAAPAPPRA